MYRGSGFPARGEHRQAGASEGQRLVALGGRGAEQRTKLLERQLPVAICVVRRQRVAHYLLQLRAAEAAPVGGSQLAQQVGA